MTDEPMTMHDQAISDAVDAACEPLIRRINQLERGISAIKLATVNGRVCDDVAWFDQITTLHDYCEQLLEPN